MTGNCPHRCTCPRTCLRVLPQRTDTLARRASWLLSIELVLQKPRTSDRACATTVLLHRLLLQKTGRFGVALLRPMRCSHLKCQDGPTPELPSQSPGINEERCCLNLDKCLFTVRAVSSSLPPCSKRKTTGPSCYMPVTLHMSLLQCCEANEAASRESTCQGKGQKPFIFHCCTSQSTAGPLGGQRTMLAVQACMAMSRSCDVLLWQT